MTVLGMRRERGKGKNDVFGIGKKEVGRPRDERERTGRVREGESEDRLGRSKSTEQRRVRERAKERNDIVNCPTNSRNSFLN